MRILKIILPIALALSATAAQASDQSGYVADVQFTGSRILFYLTGARTARPSCDCCNRWELDGSNAAGQSQLAILLTAKALHNTIDLAGAGSCVGGTYDTEAVNLLAVHP